MRKINQIEPWLGIEEKRAVIDYLDSGAWLTEFEKTREFERIFADYVGSKYACAVCNGTISLVVALMTLGIGRKDEVIVPDFTMIATANAVTLIGAKPILVDINLGNLCLDLEKTKKAITSRTKAILYVSLNGRSHNMESVINLAKEHNLYLIEDAAQSLGSKYSGKFLGTFGDIGSFSLSYPKIITTGQGGVLVTDNPEFYEKMSMIKDFGRQRSGIDVSEVIGLNAKFTDLQAVIGIEQMKKLDWRVKRKKEIFNRYRELLGEEQGIQFIETSPDVAPWFIDILTGEQRELSLFLKDKGIGTRPFYLPIHNQVPYSQINIDFWNSEYISKYGLWLPSSSFLKDEDIDYICDLIKEFLEVGLSK